MARILIVGGIGGLGPRGVIVPDAPAVRPPGPPCPYAGPASSPQSCSLSENAWVLGIGIPSKQRLLRDALPPQRAIGVRSQT